MFDAFCIDTQTHSFLYSIEGISKPQIMFKGKARSCEKAQYPWWYVSIRVNRIDESDGLS